MFWVTKVVAPALLVLVAGTAMVMADGQPPFGRDGQPPFGKFQPGKDDKKFDKKPEEKKGEEKKDDKKFDKKPEEKKFEKKVEEKKGPPPKPDATVDAWVKVLLDKITDPHDTVRDSARGAIIAVGPQAVPALEKLADGTDTAKAVAARKLIGAIHAAHARGPGQPRPGPEPKGPPAKGPGDAAPKGPPFGFPGMGPGDRGRGFGGFGWGRRGRDIDVEIAPMPRDAR